MKISNNRFMIPLFSFGLSTIATSLIDYFMYGNYMSTYKYNFLISSSYLFLGLFLAFIKFKDKKNHNPSLFSYTKDKIIRIAFAAILFFFLAKNYNLRSSDLLIKIFITHLSFMGFDVMHILFKLHNREDY